MSSSIDTIRRLANLSGNYVISDEDTKMKTRVIKLDDGRSISAISKGLTQDELKSYNVFPIIRIDKEQITYVKLDDVRYNEKKYVDIDPTKHLTIPRSKINNVSDDDIVFICRNSGYRFGFPLQDFWCEYINSNYIAYNTDASPLRPGTEYKYLWYYGKKIGSKGGRPRRRTTFRQRRLKRAAAKSRRRATRTRRRV
jgi:hypothetical protein